MNDTANSTNQGLIDRGGSQTDLRRYNERVVLAALDRQPGLFNAELARRTGLAAQTISVILRALDGQGLVERGQALRGRRGQPATPLFLKSDAAFGLGAALCWRGLSICMSDFSGAVLAHDRAVYDYPDFNETIDRFSRGVENLLAKLSGPQKERVSGLGLALPAAIDRCLAALGAPPAVIGTWQRRNFASELSQSIGLPVWPTSYGAAASSAEARSMGQKRSGEFVYFFIGTLLMGGVVSANGDPVHTGPNGSMLGAMVVPGENGTSVRADTIVSGWGLETALGSGGGQAPRSVAPDWDWTRQAPAVEAWLDRAARALAHVIVNTQCAFDLDTMVIDGILPRSLIDALIGKVEARLMKMPMAGERLPELRAGQLGMRGAMLGAARFSFHQRFFNTDPNG